ncbi:MAG: DUF692 domain-containing protein [Deltaproteobacteria bacterium]|nr:DUF692 domain-containing protein [Deltaproteobacteria bacterium]MBW2254027.1 DUF692 domain-containing protein [Deltaproteobacteria bacterium]
MHLVSRFNVPDLGIGVGYRVPHYEQVVHEHPEMDWFEVISENFMDDGGLPQVFLERLRDHYRVVPHGVSLNLGGEGNPDHLRRLRALADRIDAPWVTDHVCLTGTPSVQVHDLLPVPYTTDVLAHMAERIRRVQGTLGRPFAVENPSSYLTWKASEMPEWAFLADLVERADCGILLDVNNVYVSACNHGFDPVQYIDALPVDRVVQVHLAGHSIRRGFRLDTHDAPVSDEVWALYRHAVQRIGPVSTLIEWDGHIPSFARLQQEVERARQVRDEALAEVRHAA